MIYSNPEFFFLLVPTLFVYLLARSYRTRFYCLLVSSLLFYAWAGIQDTLIFFFVITSSWLAVWAAKRFPRAKGAWITFGITVMALHLFFWKYAPWVVAQIQEFFPHFLNGKAFDLPLPVGISFFTLQGIAYLVDYRAHKTDLMTLKEYFLFKSFFPQLVAGPIVRVHQLLPQLRELKAPLWSDFAAGISLFCMGFAKKLLIADRTAQLVDPVFAAPKTFDRITLIAGILGYTVQIWADFSGYTDMGRGVARCFGIRLPENFLSPYFSKDPSEFWKRWHVTLSQWIRDYLYIPMGGNRGSLLRVTFVTLATMGIAGLWHGANWTFLIWGLYHGALLIAYRLGREKNWIKLVPWLSVLLTQGAVAIGWVIFRAPNLNKFIEYITKIILGGPGISMGFRFWALGVAISLTGFFHVILFKDLSSGRYPVLERIRDGYLNFETRFGGRAPVTLGLLSGLFLGVAFSVTLLARVASVSQPFIYFQF
jgi:alginate O-acetyltransferase complex protein AlgI